MRLFPTVRYDKVDVANDRRKYRGTSVSSYYDPRVDEIVLAPKKWRASVLIELILHEFIHFVLEHTLNRIKRDMLDAYFDRVTFRLRPYLE